MQSIHVLEVLGWSCLRAVTNHQATWNQEHLARFACTAGDQAGHGKDPKVGIILRYQKQED